MGQVTQAMRLMVDWLLQTSWQAAFIVVVVLLLQWVFERRLPSRWRYSLWALVIVRLVMPAMPDSRLSVYNLLSPSQTEPVVMKAAVGEARTFYVANSPASETPLSPLVVHEPEPGWRSDWRVGAGMVWLGGAIAMGIAILRSHVRLKRRIATGAVPCDARMLDLLEKCKCEMGVSRHVDLVMSDVVRSPALMGLWHAKLLVPVGLPQSLTPAELRFIFLHELAHLKCCDIAADWFLALLRIMHWFNPLICLGMNRLRADRELARDAMVLWVTGRQEEQRYGQTILHLIEQFGQPEAGLGAVGVADGKGQLKRRICMIASTRRDMKGGAMLGLTLMLAMAFVMLTDREAKTNEVLAQVLPPQSQPSNGRDKTVTEVYYIGDLLMDRPVAQACEIINGIIDLIKESEGEAGWATGASSIRADGANLAVSTTGRHHKRVVSVLERLRETRGVSIYVKVYVLTVPKGFLAEYRKDAGKRWTPLTSRTAVGGADGRKIMTTDGTALLEHDDVNQLLMSVQASRTATIVSVPGVNAFNGQNARIQTGNEIPYIADLKLIKTQDGQTQYEPQMDKMFSGIKIGVQPTASADRKWVTLNFEAILTEVGELEKVPCANAPAGQDLYTHKVATKVLGVKTQATVPDTRALLLVGPQLDGEVEGSGTEAMDMVLLVKPSVIIKRDQATPQSSLLK